jgi:hypothetical protein
MKLLTQYSCYLLLAFCSVCSFGVQAADVKSDPLNRARIFIDAGRLKDAVAVLKVHEPRDPKEAQLVTLLMDENLSGD